MLSLEDLFKANSLRPELADPWRRLGDALTEMNKFKPAIEYYEAAMRYCTWMEPLHDAPPLTAPDRVDDSLVSTLLPMVERLRLMERLVENAEARGFNVDEMLALIEEN